MLMLPAMKATMLLMMTTTTNIGQENDNGDDDIDGKDDCESIGKIYCSSYRMVLEVVGT